MLFCVSFALMGQTGPGGVGNSTTNFLHLKADAGTSTTTNGVSLAAWSDQSGNGNNFLQGNGSIQPVYRTNQLNSLPAITFNGTNQYLQGPSVFPTNSDYTKFVVAQINGTGPNNNAFSGTNNHAFYFSAGSNSIKLFHGGTFVSSSIPTPLNTFQVLSGTLVNSTRLGEVFVNGASGGTGTASQTNNDNTMFVGAYGAGGNLFTGSIAEVIGYNIRLNTTQRTVVENYISAKYAISISNSRYSYATVHPNDVVGIGRTSSTDSHLASRSSRILDISQPAVGSFADGDYMVMGHDGASATVWTTTEIPSSTPNIRRLPREWRVSITGATTTATLGIDNSILPAFPASYTKYVVMIDADGDFTSGATVYELPSVTASSFQRAGITIANGNYITVGVVIPTIQFASSTTEAFENISQPITVALNYNTSTAVTVNYTSAPGTATNPADYTVPGTTATISAGSSTTTIVPAIVNDTAIESDETFTVTLASPSAGVTLGSVNVNTYTIHDDDNLRKIGFTATSSSASESVTAVSLTISINNVDVTNPTRVDYSVTGGTATGGGVDYTLAAGTATIAANTTTTTLNFTVVNDAIYEPNETIIISLTNPVNANLHATNYVYTYTIIDDDGPPVIGFTSSSASGSETVGTINFPVAMNFASYQNVTVNYTVGGTATGGGVDHTLVSGVLTIPAGSTSANITTTVINDTNVEATETIIITLSSPSGATLGTSVYTYTLFDDDVIGYTGPGGVGDNAINLLWLRADRGTNTTTNNGVITSWTDQSGSTTNANQATAANQPTFKTNQINSLPTINFVPGQFLNCPSVFPTNSDYSKFVVTRLTTSAGTTNNIMSGANGHALYFGGGTAPLLYHNGNFVSSSINVTVGTFAIITGTFINSSLLGQIYVNGTSGGTGTASQANGDGTIQLGAYASGNFMNGDLSEAIAYRIRMNNAQRKIVENYLSSKYGIAIANDRYSFDAAHGFDVAGIGRDNTNDVHFDSRGSGNVRINNASSLDDGDYLLWGHNGQVFTSQTNDVPSGIVNRLMRVWRADQPASTSVGTVNLSFDVTGLVVASGNDLELLIDGDGVFASGATRYTTGRSYNAGTKIISFTGVTLPAGTYFTLGSNSTSSTLPITLTNFSAAPDPATNSVHINWTTSSEVNNKTFIVQRSMKPVNGEWEEVATVAGAGTTTSEKNYAANDVKPLDGTSYYRLVQMDYDNTPTYSKIVQVMFEQMEFMVCYPNPTNDNLTISLRQPATISISNATGDQILNQQVKDFIRFSTRDIPSGLYFVRTIDQNGRPVVKKIVVAH